MPLLDHFRAPLYPRHHWESLHARWASAIADSLNEVLPRRFFAEPQSHASGRIEIDVATFEEQDAAEDSSAGAVALAAVRKQVWAPAAPMLVMPAVFPGTFRVHVFRDEGGAILVGAIELVSPANKDRPEERRAFAVKCANYLQQGVSLAIADIVTNRHANLHNELVALMGHTDTCQFGEDNSLYAASYRPIRRGDTEQVEIWPARLSLNAALPTLPLFLASDLCVPLNLETTYDEACRRLRLT